MNISDKPSLSNEDSADFSIGSVLFERFQILAEIASGGQGRVYKAHDLVLNKLVALKVLLSNSVTDRDIMRFQHEARLASKMKHQSIATIYDFGIYRNTLFLSMEFVEGESLDSILNLKHTIPILDFLEIFLQVADAIKHAHALNIIHRDLKPGNIIVSTGTDGTTQAKVLDFGVAKQLDIVQENSRRLTPTGNLVGSPFFMSPEQGQGIPLTTKSDIYSLGSLMWTCLAGEPPFVGDNAMETLFCHANTKLPDLSSLVDERIPAKLIDLINRLLSKTPDDRPELTTTVIPVLEDLLDECLSVSPQAAQLSTRVAHDTADSATEVRSPAKPATKILTVVGLSILVCGIGGVLYALTMPTDVEGTVAKASSVYYFTAMDFGTKAQKDDVELQTMQKELKEVESGKSTDLSLRIGYSKELLSRGLKVKNLKKLDLAQTNVSDAEIEEIVKAPNLTALVLNSSRVKTLAGLEKATKLDNLELKNTQINNESLRHVAKLKLLRELNLTHDEIDENGIANLTPLKKLAVLDLTGIDLTPKAAQYLKQFPKLKILILDETSTPASTLRDLLHMPTIAQCRLTKCKTLDRMQLQQFKYDFPTVSFDGQSSMIEIKNRLVSEAEKNHKPEIAYRHLHVLLELLEKRFGKQSPITHEPRLRLATQAELLGKKSEARALVREEAQYFNLRASQLKKPEIIK